MNRKLYRCGLNETFFFKRANTSKKFSDFQKNHLVTDIYRPDHFDNQYFKIINKSEVTKIKSFRTYICIYIQCIHVLKSLVNPEIKIW